MEAPGSVSMVPSPSRRSMKRVSSWIWVCLCAAVGNGCASAPTPEEVRFEDLSSWTYVDGLRGMPERVRALSGRWVTMVGHLSPIDRVSPPITEAELVHTLGARGARSTHHTVHVVKADGFSRDLLLHDKGVEVTGRFEVRATVIDGYCVHIYHLHAERIEPR